MYISFTKQNLTVSGKDREQTSQGLYDMFAPH